VSRPRVDAIVRGAAALLARGAIGLLTCAMISLAQMPASQPTSRPSTRSTAPTSTRPAHPLPGFTPSAHFGEQIKAYELDPEVKVHINAPGDWDAAKPTTLILYTLPNGNTTEQTIGKAVGPGVDWHFGIQHIGAQTRRLREVDRDENIVIAYLEAGGRSWPAWKTRHPDYLTLIPRIVDDVCRAVPAPLANVVLTGHSGGGSFVLRYIDAAERIPDRITRLSFLDSDYNYTDAQHGDKLVAWLKARPDHFLSVIAYDDRNVTLDGEPIVSAEGGTYRQTQKMLDRLRKDFEFTTTPGLDHNRYRGLNGRIDIILHENPRLAILHTALVGDMSGFLHAMTCGTRYEPAAGEFKGPITYGKWIQPD
jgi:pimeloyl-ACP methyl ester carboxylesterase